MLRTYAKLCLAVELSQQGLEPGDICDIVLHDIYVIDEIKQVFFDAHIVHKQFTLRCHTVASYGDGRISTALFSALTTPEGVLMATDTMMASASQTHMSSLDTLDSLAVMIAHSAIAVGIDQYEIADWNELLEILTVKAVNVDFKTTEE